MNITAKNNEAFQFCELLEADSHKLGSFFEALSEETRSRFGPHPLTQDYAINEIFRQGNSSNVTRYVISSDEKIVGYFIIDYNHFPHEKSRYDSYGKRLDFSVDPVFAPCIADNYQNLGVASQAMDLLIRALTEKGVRSIVLMGGTQEPNHLARNFYTKFGFKEEGEFYTDYNKLNNIDMRLAL